MARGKHHTFRMYSSSQRRCEQGPAKLAFDFCSTFDEHAHRSCGIGAPCYRRHATLAAPQVLTNTNERCLYHTKGPIVNTLLYTRRYSQLLLSLLFRCSSQQDLGKLSEKFTFDDEGGVQLYTLTAPATLPSTYLPTRPFLCEIPIPIHQSSYRASRPLLEKRFVRRQNGKISRSGASESYGRGVSGNGQPTDGHAWGDGGWSGHSTYTWTPR